ncbi:DUF5518 domain-containing protein [Halococcus hamelinensis]|uniref:Uncharacterized protein n=1 Tax=Halococcus hamelinensis 100A6 TaxID=1132509 RepID=M0LZX0_9EURY|nr:DUF5518 domain-containing protein [Halococcus hamelinensis]EMA39097.1 hypothetical protein C447_08068 [Halococcus hamelinensis 100A6]
MVFDGGSAGRYESWKYALLGGVVSVPFTVVVHVTTSSGIEFSSGTMVLGGGVAGYLAERGAGDAGFTGALAGAIGSLPLLRWWSTTFAYIPFRYVPWTEVPSRIAYLSVLSLVVFLGSVLAGWLGGRLGGWLSRSVRCSKTSGTES